MRVGRQVRLRAGLGRRLHDRDLGVGAHLRDEPADGRLGPPMPPGRPLSTTAMSGEIVPGPSVRSSSSSPWTDEAWDGSPLLEPGVRESSGAGRAQSTRKPPVSPATIAGRRMITSAIRPQTPPSRSGRSPISGTRRRRRLEPKAASRAGSSVIAARIDTSGMSRPPTPMERMNGRGISTRQASPIATVTPEKRTAWPAVRIVVRRASRSSAPPRSSSRKR